MSDNKYVLEFQSTAMDGTNFGPDLDFASAEAYNVVRTNIMLSLHGKAMGKTIGVSSSTPQEGKSVTTLNLAYAIAKNGCKTIVINADLRKPSIEKKLGVKMHKGLSNILCGEFTYDNLPIINSVLHQNLDIIMAGDVPPNPSELLSSDEMKKLLEHLSKTYEYILLDLPPITSVIDAVAISPMTDGIVVIVKHGFTQKKFLRKAMDQLQYAGARVLGFVYNGYDMDAGGYSRGKHYKYYKKGYGYYRSSYGYGYYGKTDGNEEKAADIPTNSGKDEAKQ